MAVPDLTTEAGMLAFLNSNFRPCTHIAKVASAGHSAWVFRATLAPPLPTGTASVVIKHVQSHAARTFDLTLDPGRMDYEAHALALLPSIRTSLAYETPYSVPRLERYFADRKVLVLEDLGDLPMLKHWVTARTPTEVADGIGRALACFLADLHDASVRERGLLAGFEKHVNGRELSASFIFGAFMAGQARKYGVSDPVIADAAATARDEVLHDDEVLTMGDFWTGNVLVRDTDTDTDGDGDRDGDGDGGESGRASGIPRLHVVDFELMKPGPASYDVGQMAAEMYFMTKYGDAEKGAVLLKAFLEGYRERREVDVYKVAIRVGAHLVAVGEMTNPAASEEQVRELVREGVSFIKAGWNKDGEFLRASVLAPLIAR